MPTPYGNRIDPVTDLFKQYKVRIWMSTVGLSFGCESSRLLRTGRGTKVVKRMLAIIKTGGGNSSLPVRPGFGAGYQNTPSLRNWFTHARA